MALDIHRYVLLHGYWVYENFRKCLREVRLNNINMSQIKCVVSFHISTKQFNLVSLTIKILEPMHITIKTNQCECPKQFCRKKYFFLFIYIYIFIFFLKLFRVIGIYIFFIVIVPGLQIPLGPPGEGLYQTQGLPL